MGKKKRIPYKNNAQFIDSALVNDATYFDYLERFKKIALSMFEWVNLPKSMNAQWLEKCLYYDGMGSLLKDKDFGFINTKCASNGYINIYGLPSSLNCYSFDYQTIRKLYTGIDGISEARREYLETSEAILVQNNWDRTPTCTTIELFAYRLYEAEQTAMVNIKAQKTPVMVLVNEQQRVMMENLYSQYDGNKPFIFGDKDQLGENVLRAVNTGAPFVADKIMNYKKEIWNEALTFLGINNIMVEKKERLITDEANSNNELINLNLQSYLAPRQEACRQFNEKFGLVGTDKEISVRVRSDLHNIIKNAQSMVTDIKNKELEKTLTEGVEE
nr:MAG TPA: upper collar protein [Caudoviricetes sp.]